MRIKQMEIDGKKLSFGKDDNLIFIRDTTEDIFDSAFLKAIKNLFVDTVDVGECDNKEIKCVCEAYGTDFIITASVDEKGQNGEQLGYAGNYSVRCESPFDSKTSDNVVLKRLCEADFKRLLIPDVTKEVIFYKNYTTNDLITHYKTALRQGKAKGVKDEYFAQIEIICAKIDEFIKDFKEIDLGALKFGFDKKTKELKDVRAKSHAANKKADFLDYITANKLNGIIEKSCGREGNAPLFIEWFFKEINPEDIGFFIEELRGLDRQVFIIESENNPLLEKLCDKTIIV